jgi:hypothetical protein
MSEFIMAAAKPTLLTTGGELWICSTPFGKQGFFWDCFQNKNNRFKVFHISSEEVIQKRPISESWTEKKRTEALEFLKNEKADMTELQYGQEYLGLFLEELQRLFDDRWIEKVCIIKRDNIVRGKTYMGIDVAAMGSDKNSFEVFDKLSKEEIRQIDNFTTTKQYTHEVIDKILKFQNLYRNKKIGVDDAGVGFGVFSELLNNPKTKDRVIGLNNSRRPLDSDGKAKKRLLKEDMYFTLLNLGEKGFLKLLDDLDIKQSLSSVQIEVKDDKIFIFGKDTHIAEGIIRGVYLADQDRSLNLWAA